ncbi:MAG: holin [Muribaculaceae bacterium]|nr:holin [Muribaculaceae bacterium]
MKDEMKYKLPSEVYDVLKWVGLALLPALGVLVSTVGKAWGFPYVEPTVITIDALGVFIATIIGYSHLTAEPIDA